jgi:hypothetical protein
VNNFLIVGKGKSMTDVAIKKFGEQNLQTLKSIKLRGLARQRDQRSDGSKSF